MAPSDQPIGIFDSGVGGLTVVRAIVDTLPRETIVYLGDTARVPYGNRESSTVQRYAKNATDLLVDRGIKMLVVACNTASAHALEALRDHVDIPVVGVVEPVSERAVEQTGTGAVGVLGTRGTVRSRCYPNALHSRSPDLDVHQIPAPLLVPLAEEGWLDGPVPTRVAREYVGKLQSTRVDTIILGCTHYPVLQSTLSDVARELLEQPVDLLGSGAATARRTRALLERRELGHPSADEGSLDLMLTDLSPAFVEATERFFGDRPEDIRHVDLV